jgi:aryl-alcohol dehydrogenase-like predicted oxidoreductase
MQYVNLGNTRLKVSRICLGCMSDAVTEGAWRHRAMRPRWYG